MKVLPKEYRRLLFEFESLEGTKLSFYEEAGYRQGLKDGVRLAKDLGINELTRPGLKLVEGSQAE